MVNGEVVPDAVRLSAVNPAIDVIVPVLCATVIGVVPI